MVAYSRLTVDLTIWYPPVTVKLYFSLILMHSMTSCQFATNRCVFVVCIV